MVHVLLTEWCMVAIDSHDAVLNCSTMPCTADSPLLCKGIEAPKMTMTVVYTRAHALPCAATPFQAFRR